MSFIEKTKSKSKVWIATAAVAGLVGSFVGGVEVGKATTALKPANGVSAVSGQPNGQGVVPPSQGGQPGTDGQGMIPPSQGSQPGSNGQGMTPPPGAPNSNNSNNQSSNTTQQQDPSTSSNNANE
ncbi:hypothetical protein [Streptococcus plurextorum]|uniref:hypothetical protein n=1 Tax=Streptococcus plurextorum TaxID=456876 RepID=UPI000421B1D2|nr:hypothetical protein [Streptococcus plurextorum]